MWKATTATAKEIKSRMGLIFLFFHSLTFVCGIKGTESAFESGENEKAGINFYSIDEKADNLNQNESSWREKSESGQETEALSRLEIELEELLQNHIAVEIQQQEHQEYQQREQQEYQQREHQQQHGIRLRR